MTFDEYGQVYHTALRVEKQTRQALHLCEDLRMGIRLENRDSLRKLCAPDICAAIYLLDDAAWRLRRLREFMEWTEGHHGSGGNA